MFCYPMCTFRTDQKVRKFSYPKSDRSTDQLVLSLRVHLDPISCTIHGLIVVSFVVVAAVDFEDMSIDDEYSHGAVGLMFAEEVAAPGYPSLGLVEGHLIEEIVLCDKLDCAEVRLDVEPSCSKNVELEK